MGQKPSSFQKQYTEYALKKIPKKRTAPDPDAYKPTKEEKLLISNIKEWQKDRQLQAPATGLSGPQKKMISLGKVEWTKDGDMVMTLTDGTSTATFNGERNMEYYWEFVHSFVNQFAFDLSKKGFNTDITSDNNIETLPDTKQVYGKDRNGYIYRTFNERYKYKLTIHKLDNKS